MVLQVSFHEIHIIILYNTLYKTIRSGTQFTRINTMTHTNYYIYTFYTRRTSLSTVLGTISEAVSSIVFLFLFSTCFKLLSSSKSSPSCSSSVVIFFDVCCQLIHFSVVSRTWFLTGFS